MVELIHTLQARYADDPNVYVSGNLLIFYVPGNKRRHLSPDVFVAKGVAKHDRLNYLTWEEGKGPDLVIELTSSSTRNEDVVKKFKLYEQTLRVAEYFLFDPFGDYLDPPMRGYRLHQRTYRAIRPIKGRLPSRVVGLHLERVGKTLRLFDPAAGQLLETPAERVRHAESRAEQAERENEHCVASWKSCGDVRVEKTEQVPDRRTLLTRTNQRGLLNGYCHRHCRARPLGARSGGRADS
jgi:Uma2 family endonuclease